MMIVRTTGSFRFTQKRGVGVRPGEVRFKSKDSLLYSSAITLAASASNGRKQKWTF